MSKTSNKSNESTPYLVVVYSGSGLSAVYNRHYELIFEGASERLLAYAAQWHTTITLGLIVTQPEQQPSWMIPDIEDKCVCYHLYKDSTSKRELRNIPER